jgi:hypothetical protein
VRLLKDAMLAFSPGRRGCGWHVDDHALWPTHDDDHGVNLWISLSDLRAADGGGLAVVPGSHRSKEARACREIIGGEQPLTCSLHTLAPEWHAWMESRGVEYDMEPGDALLLDRHTFHRSSPFRTPQPPGTRALRLSIRYAPAGARLVDNGIERDAMSVWVRLGKTPCIMRGREAPKATLIPRLPATWHRRFPATWQMCLYCTQTRQGPTVGPRHGGWSASGPRPRHAAPACASRPAALCRRRVADRPRQQHGLGTLPRMR